MSKKEKIGGFAIEFSKRGDYEFLVAETRAGNWRMVQRSDSEVYWIMKSMWEGDDDGTNVYKEYVHSYVQMCYICANVSPDEQWVSNFVDIYNKYCDRVKESRGEDTTTEEEAMQMEIAREMIKAEKHEQRESSADDSQNG